MPNLELKLDTDMQILVNAKAALDAHRAGEFEAVSSAEAYRAGFTIETETSLCESEAALLWSNNVAIAIVVPPDNILEVVTEWGSVLVDLSTSAVLQID